MKRKDKRVIYVCYHCGGPLDENLRCADPDHEGIISRGRYFRLKEIIEADEVLSAYPELKAAVFGPPRKPDVRLWPDPDFEGFD